MPANRGSTDESAPGAAAGVCPECGAPATDGLTCWAQLGAILAWEWGDPALQAQHFLTVACYNLQHPAQFTGEALAGLRELFVAHLEQGTEIAELRQFRYKLRQHLELLVEKGFFETAKIDPRTDLVIVQRRRALPN